MAHLHFRRTVYKSGGQKASGRLAYLSGTRIDTSAHAEAQLTYLSHGREDLVAEGTHNLPSWANTAQDFFVAAEHYERQSLNDYQRRGIAFEEWKITLPHELSRQQNLDLVQDLIAMIAGDRLPCTYAVHDPLTLRGTQHQPHIHLLISGRMNDGYTRTPAQHFKRWNSTQPERGGARKDAALNHRGAVKAHRLMIADMLNIHLEQYGFSARVHPDTLESRGIERDAEPKLLPSESAAYREKGIVGATMAAVLGVRQSRGKTRTKEQNTAYQAWEERKAFLGIDRAMPREEKLAAILLKRHGKVAQVPARYRPLAEAQERRRQRGKDRQDTRPLAQQIAALTARLDGEEQEAHGRGVRVRVWDREKDQGLGW
jgi:hypothetical protein